MQEEQELEQTPVAEEAPVLEAPNVEPEDDSRSTDPLKRRNKKFSWRDFGGPGFIFSLVFHGILLVIAIFLVVRHIVKPPVEEPDAFVTGAGGGSNGDRASMQEHRMKPRQNMMQSKARITSKSSNSTIALPEMPAVAMSSSFSSGMSAGGDSSGFGGGSGGGVGTGKGMGVGHGKNFVSPFGTRSGGNRVMKGYLFDLKRGKQGTVLATVEGGDKNRRKEQLHKALGILDTGGWQVRKLQDLYFQAPTTLYNTRIFIVNETGNALNANLATDAFADEKTGKAPFKAPGWLCYYEGSFRVPEDGEYRFVGMGDDAMIVGVERKTVLYAYWPGEGHGPAVKYQKDWEPKNHCGKGGQDGKNLASPGQRSSLYKGHWLKLKANRNYRIQVAFGEAAGGLAGACLGIQKKGRDNDNSFPMFSLQGSDDIPEWGISGSGRYNLSENYQIPGR